MAVRVGPLGGVVFCACTRRKERGTQHLLSMTHDMETVNIRACTSSGHAQPVHLTHLEGLVLRSQGCRPDLGCVKG